MATPLHRLGPRPRLPSETRRRDLGREGRGNLCCQPPFTAGPRALGSLKNPGGEPWAGKEGTPFVATPPRQLGQGRGGRSLAGVGPSISAIGDRMKPFIETEEIAGAVTPDRIAYV